MTALEKFLEQIVLKKVKGSVYLVPAICDFQIEEALEEERKQGQTLPISDVRLSFVDWVEKNYPTLKNHGDSLTLSELRTAYRQYANEA